MKIKKQLQLAWLAGFFDGEGCVRLERALSNSKTGNFAWHIRVIFTNTHLPTLIIANEILNSEGILSHLIHAENAKHRLRWELRLSGNKAALALKLMLPFLITKKEQTVLALEARNYLFKRRNHRIPNPHQDKLEVVRIELARLKRIEYKAEELQ